MSNRIFDSSQLTKRRAEKAIAGSFLTRMMAPNNLQGSAPYLGIKDVSIMNAVKTGGMTEYTRYPTCVAISPGCPCPEANADITAIPGPVSGITITVGSIIVSWNPPSVGSGPFTYVVTPYLNGVAQPSVTTGETQYRFADLQDWQPYTFTVVAVNSAGSSPNVVTPYILAPPADLSRIMSGSSDVILPEPSLKYVMNIALNAVLKYVASVNLGPTRGSRFIYVWVMSVVAAWNWVRPEKRIPGIHDKWDWDNKLYTPLSNNDSIIWLCTAIDHITQSFLPSSYKRLFSCPDTIVNRIKIAGEWDTWVAAWQAWFNGPEGREADGYKAAATAQPTTSANWDKTIVVDGTTVNDISGFPQPQQWTRLTVQGKKQGYLTHTWDSVQSTCLSESDEVTIEDSVTPLTGAERDAEVDDVLEIAAGLTDEQKIIAEFWAGGPGTISPPLMFIWLWKEYILSNNSLSHDTIMYSLLDLAIHLFEGGRVTWRLKAKYMEARPIQEIRRRYAGQQIQSWNGTVNGAQWVPYQEANFITPPFADFPSGHSHFSKAFALTMNNWFGSNIIKSPVFYDGLELICPVFKTGAYGTFGDFTIPLGKSNIQANVPASPITLSFTTWDEIADQAGMSRLYGGIHCLTAHTASQTVASIIDSYINSRWYPGNPYIPIPDTDESKIISNPSSTTPLKSSASSNVISMSSNTTISKPYSMRINYITRPPVMQVQNLINQSKTIIESIVTTSHGLRSPGISALHDMIVDIYIQSLPSSVLASASPVIVNTSVVPAMPLRQKVVININRLNELVLTTAQFNNKTVAKMIPVLVHEMLHGLGIAAFVYNGVTIGWDRFIDSTKTWYVGPGGDWTKSEAIKAYREIVGTGVTRIPIENSFGSGTAYSHWEEGLKEGFVKEGRYFNYGGGNVLHPALPEEIMTGLAGSRFYFTKMTAGALVDRGYKVDMTNPNIVSYPAELIQRF